MIFNKTDRKIENSRVLRTKHHCWNSAYYTSNKCVGIWKRFPRCPSCCPFATKSKYMKPAGRTWLSKHAISHVSYLGHVAKSGLISKMLRFSHFKHTSVGKKQHPVMHDHLPSTHLMSCNNDLEAWKNPSFLTNDWFPVLAGSFQRKSSPKKSPESMKVWLRLASYPQTIGSTQSS